MINRFFRVLPIIFLFSCGIPSFDYIGGATVSGTSFTIDYNTYPLTTGFLIYSRYYASDSKSSKFSNITIADTKSNSVKYVNDLGFTPVDFIPDDTDYTNFNYENDNISISNMPVSEYSTYSIDYIANDSGVTIKLTNKNTNKKYYLKSNSVNGVNIIGYFDDTQSKDFLDAFIKKEKIDSSLQKIYIEFVIIINGVSNTLEPLESLPVYLNRIEIRTN